MEGRLTAVGSVSGIGSMLVGARQAGFEVLANVEHRRYYHARDPLGRNTFTENFQGAIFKEKITDLTPQEIERIMNPTLVLSHCECGNFSQLNAVNKNRKEKLNDAGDIPVLIETLKVLKPRFFAADNLPKSLGAVSIMDYAKQLPDMDLFPELISNWGYGNVQKNRNRFFLIGALKSERFVFRPGERANTRTIADVLGDLGTARAGSNWPNHDPHARDEICQRAKHLAVPEVGRGGAATFGQLADYYMARRPGFIMEYVSGQDLLPGQDASDANRHMGYKSPWAMDGKLVKVKPGHMRANWDGHAYVLDGASVQVHPLTGLPYSIRERAKLQGFPDDFVFYGTKLNATGEWNHEKNVNLVKMTGKCMPVEFNRFLSEQIAAHVRGQPFEASGRRILSPRPEVDDAKRTYCEEVGYSDQARACGACWLYDSCTIRMRKYQIGEPARGQWDLYQPGLMPGPDSELEAATGAASAAGGAGGPLDSMLVGSPAAPRKRRKPPVEIVPRVKAHARFAEVSREEEYDL